ncbi:hypothetical protein PBCVKS1B_043R [Paramecium bursaria Chlorella virus KS1B]|uniref:Uncharacterized protein n=1 Tax=Paramecium bursaria Chlorella virus 1 TaxID=10506 RepID=Q84411_PBCV1|nr:hypothetical protein PBCV1_A090R [Paramecium bursaria Chlorella virus 1]AAC96458.1 hypothetical protein [Paramecium bursaria Chlorella virus 1]AGE54463.1 hypothetical protein PBCVKS1B_043R [Paramecium bursaria Chlorella virus KS1B]
MDSLEEFKTEVKKLIEHLNEEVRKYEFEKEEEYDPIIGKIIYDYCKQRDTLILDSITHDGVNLNDSDFYLTEYHGCEPKFHWMPRDFFGYVVSKDYKYEAGFGTVIYDKTNFLVYLKGKHPTFILEHIHLVSDNNKIVYRLSDLELTCYNSCHL